MSLTAAEQPCTHPEPTQGRKGKGSYNPRLVSVPETTHAHVLLVRTVSDPTRKILAFSRIESKKIPAEGYSLTLNVYYSHS